MVVLGVFALISMGIGLLIGATRGQPQFGLLLGLLGPVGWIIAALLPLSYEKQVQREVARRQAMRDADERIAAKPAEPPVAPKPQAPAGVSRELARSMASLERRTYR